MLSMMQALNLQMWLQQVFGISMQKSKDNYYRRSISTHMYSSSCCCNILMQKSKNNIDQLAFKFTIVLLKHITAVIRTPELICNHISNIFLHYQLQSSKFYFVFIIFKFFRLKVTNCWNLQTSKRLCDS